MRQFRWSSFVRSFSVLRIEHRMQQLIELDGATRSTASFLVIMPSSTISTATRTAAGPVRLPLRVCSMYSLPSWMVNSKSCMSL